MLTRIWGAYLGEDGQRNGIRAKISSWERIGPNVVPHAAKVTGIYVNSLLAVNEALAAGYDEAILLTASGVVAEMLERRIKDPRLGFVTVTDVRVSGDTQQATVFYTVLGEEGDLESTAAALESALRALGLP